MATDVSFEMNNTDIFNHLFYCTGQEMNMTSCSLNYIPAGDDICISGLVAGVECGIGNITLHRVSYCFLMLILAMLI